MGPEVSRLIQLIIIIEVLRKIYQKGNAFLLTFIAKFGRLYMRLFDTEPINGCIEDLESTNRHLPTDNTEISIKSIENEKI